MTNFVIRVELHDANSNDYANLARNLAQYGITDVIRAASGHGYRMPPGEYNYTGNLTRDTVHQNARAATVAVGRRYAILTTEAVSSTWEGLPVLNYA